MQTIIAYMNTHPTIGAAVNLVASIVVAVIVVSVVLRLERKAARRLMKKHGNINTRFVESVSRFVIIFVAVQWVVMSSPLTKSFGSMLFQGTAIIGAIAGFAAQPVIADLICGLMMSATKPFDIGDRIELEDGSAGIVKDITLRHVVLQDIDTVVRIIPNSKLNGMKIANMSFHTKTRSIHMRFNVAYGTDVGLAMDVIARAVRESDYSVPGKQGENGPEYSPVYFIQYADSSLVMATTVYYEPTTRTEVVKSDINTRVKRALDESGIEIPYNYVNVVVNERGEIRRRSN